MSYLVRLFTQCRCTCKYLKQSVVGGNAQLGTYGPYQRLSASTTTTAKSTGCRICVCIKGQHPPRGMCYMGERSDQFLCRQGGLKVVFNRYTSCCFALRPSVWSLWYFVQPVFVNTSGDVQPWIKPWMKPGPAKPSQAPGPGRASIYPVGSWHTENLRVWSLGSLLLMTLKLSDYQTYEFSIFAELL